MPVLALACSLDPYARDREQIIAEFAEAPGKSGGIYYAYPYAGDSVPAPPAGYEAVYISHYGRHGSRWAIREGDYPFVINALTAEEGRGNLSDDGRAVLAKVKAIAAHAEGHAGELSPLGQRQHKGIARRMIQRTPHLFADSARVIARSSVEPRCIVSMSAFSEALKEGNPKLEVTRTASPGDMAFISWSTPEAKAFNRDDAPWRAQLDGFGDSVADPTRLKSLLFNHPEKADLPRKFWRTLHDIAVTTQNVDLDVDLLGIYTPDELFGFWQFLNYKMYVGHANAPAGGAIGMNCARSLLDDIVSRADSALASADAPRVDLRFGHDTALIRLLAMMRLDGCAESEETPERYYAAWQDYNVAPMAANLQLIFYRSADSAEPLVLVLHNERPASLPISPATGQFYRWSDVRRLWSEPGLVE